MTTAHENRLVEDYLRRLDRAAAPLSGSRRAELLAEIREHIDDALVEAGADDDVAVRNALERLGPPEEIVAAAEPEQRRSGKLELAAMIALAIPFLGWFVGIVLVAASRAWTGREKAVAIALVLIPVVMLALGLVAVGSESSADVTVGSAAGPFSEQQGDSGGSGGTLGPIELVVILGTFPRRSGRRGLPRFAPTSCVGSGRPRVEPEAASAVANRSWARRDQYAETGVPFCRIAKT